MVEELQGGQAVAMLPSLGPHVHHDAAFDRARDATAGPVIAVRP